MGREDFLNRFALGRSHSTEPDWPYLLSTGSYIQIPSSQEGSPPIYKCVDPTNQQSYGLTFDQQGRPVCEESRALERAEDEAENWVTLIALEEASRSAEREKKKRRTDAGEGEGENTVKESHSENEGHWQLVEYLIEGVRECMQKILTFKPMINQLTVFKPCADMRVSQHLVWNVRTYGWFAPLAPGILESLAPEAIYHRVIIPIGVIFGALFGTPCGKVWTCSADWLMYITLNPLINLRTLQLLPPNWPVQPPIYRTLLTALRHNPGTFVSVTAANAALIVFHRVAAPQLVPYVHGAVFVPLLQFATRRLSPTGAPEEEKREEGQKQQQQHSGLGRKSSRAAQIAAGTVSEAIGTTLSWPVHAFLLRSTALMYIRAADMTGIRTPMGTPSALRDVYPPLSLWSPTAWLLRGSSTGTMSYVGKVGTWLLIRGVVRAAWRTAEWWVLEHLFRLEFFTKLFRSRIAI